MDGKTEKVDKWSGDVQNSATPAAGHKLNRMFGKHFKSKICGNTTQENFLRQAPEFGTQENFTALKAQGYGY